MSSPVFTVGHSNRSTSDFTSLLRAYGINAIADVRSHPYSRIHPQFCREPLSRDLKRSGVAYVFLGAELGARPADASTYVGGVVNFDRLASTPLFASGVRRVLKGSERYRIALLCAEKDPLGCHRAILVGRHLVAAGATVEHVVDIHTTESHENLEARLLNALGIPDSDLFRDRATLVAEAYSIQGSRIAYRVEGATEEHQAALSPSDGHQE